MIQIKTRSIRTKLSIILFLSILAIQSGLLVFEFQRVKSNMSVDLSLMKDALTRRLVIALKEPVWNYQLDIIGGIVDSEMLEPQVAAILVANQRGEIFFGRGRDDNWQPRHLLTPPEKSARYLVTQGDIKTYGEKIGHVEIVITKAFMQKALFVQMKEMILIDILADVLLFIILFFSIGRGVIRPIYLLAEGVKSIASGNLNKVIHSNSSDEIGRLARDTEQMRQAIKHLTNDLEDRVRERTVQLESTMREAKHASEIKSRFLANMSHEIRTPMNAIIGFSDLLINSGDMPGRSKDYITKVNQSAKSLLTIINDILDFSKLEAGKLLIESAVFDLSELLEEVLQTFEIEARERHLNLKADHEGEADCFVRGDQVRIKQVLINLVGNAVKFTPKGSITIRTRNTGKEFHFQVIDTGIGMTAEQAAGIFDAFRQADDTTVRQYGGTGLGTTISKQLIEAMGGRIWCDTRQGKGSVFQFTLPLETVPSPDNTDLPICPNDPAADLQSRRFNILFAEDNTINGELIMIRLGEAYGHRIKWVRDGHAAVTAFQDGKFDLILMDFQMPVMDGVQATKAIRTMENKSDDHIPIIALTASATTDEQALFKDAGMDGFVKKPVDFSELISKMEMLVPDGAGMVSEPHRGKENINGISGLEPLLDIADVESALITWGSKEEYVNALRRFCREKQDAPDELERFIAEDKLKQAELVAHTLKGLPLELTDVTGQASDIEDALKSSDLPLAKKHLAALKHSIDKVVRVMKTINLSTDENENTILAIEKEDASKLIENLISALDRAVPEEAEDLLLSLNPHLPPDWTAAIKTHIDDYDFSEASKKVQTFAGNILNSDKRPVPGE